MKIGIFIIPILAGILHATTVSDTCNQRTWVTDGPVGEIVRSGNTVFVAGAFSHVGPCTGSGVPVDASSGKPLAKFAKINGTVDAVCSDGSGGLFVGGSFTLIDGVVRNDIAHILSDGSLDPAWNPNVGSSTSPSPRVYCLAISGSTVYVGGSFDKIGGQARNNIAALDAATGNAENWDPNSDGWVLSVAVSGKTVFVGGQFSGVGNASRYFIAALDSATGLATAWNPNTSPAPQNFVQAICVSGNTVYVGGTFTTIAGKDRNHVAALDATSGNATAWNPNADNDVYALMVRGTTVYAGGRFGSIGGKARGAIAALDALTGNALPWNPMATGDGVNLTEVLSLALSGPIVFAGGYFDSIGGKARNYVAALDTSTGTAADWNPNPNSSIQCIGVTNSSVFIGGNIVTVGGQNRNCIAALDASTGVATDWDAHSNGEINCMAVSGNTVYVGGPFARIGGEDRSNLAALDAGTAKATSWNPGLSFNGTGGAIAYALAVNSGVVYVGGAFSTVGGDNRGGLAALDSATGHALPWNPNPSARDIGFPSVSSLSISGDALYVLGNFDSIGGQNRHLLAALDLIAGNATSWNPNPDSTVYTLAVHGSTVYVGGIFSNVGGKNRYHVAALDANDGNATAWNPSPNSFAYGNISKLATIGQFVYVSGEFTSIGGGNRTWIAALDSSTGSATGWNPNPDGPIAGIEATDNGIYLGGSFNSFNGVFHPGLAEFDTLNSSFAQLPPRSPASRLGFHMSMSLRGTSLTYSLPRAENVALRLYSLNGKLLCELVKGYQKAGFHAQNLKMFAPANGTYLAVLKAEDFQEEKKVLLTK